MAVKHFKSVTQLFSDSYAAVRRNLGLFIGLNSLAILSTAWQVGTDLKDKHNGANWGDIFRNGIFGNGGPGYPAGMAVGLVVAFVILSVLLALMTVILEVRAAQGKQLVFADIWEEFKGKWFDILCVEILAFLVIGLGFVALIIPGILILPRLIMAPYVLVDQNTRIVEALNKSWDMTRGYSDKVYYVILFGILLGFTGIIPVVGGIISLALGIIYSVAMPMRYFELKSKK